MQLLRFIAGAFGAIGTASMFVFIIMSSESFAQLDGVDAAMSVGIGVLMGTLCLTVRKEK